MRNLSQIKLVIGLALISGCGPREKPNFIYMPDMYYSPAYKAQEEGSMRLPVKGTIPRGQILYGFTKDQGDQAGASNTNPLPRSLTVMKRGKQVFNTMCIVCHGPNGEGDGSIIPKFPRPPSLQSDKVRGWSDGRIFHVITMGQNLMPSYASQIPVQDRWAAIHYVRVLQRSKHPSQDDINAWEIEKNK